MPALKRIPGVIQPLGNYVRRVRGFGRPVCAEANPLPANRDVSLESSSPVSDTKKASGIVFLGALPILRIYAAWRAAQVAPSVVMTDAVNVVYGARREGVCHPKKREPVLRKTRRIYLNEAIALLANRSGRHVLRAVFARSNAPSKRARRGVVVKNFAQALRGKIGFSHDALQMLIGQRPASVISAAPALLF